MVGFNGVQWPIRNETVAKLSLSLHRNEHPQSHGCANDLHGILVIKKYDLQSFGSTSYAMNASLSEGRKSKQTFLQGLCHRAGAGIDMQLCVDVAQMRIHGV